MDDMREIIDDINKKLSDIYNEIGKLHESIQETNKRIPGYCPYEDVGKLKRRVAELETEIKCLKDARA